MTTPTPTEKKTDFSLSNHLFIHLTQALTDAVIMVDHNRLIVYVNPAACSLFGYAAGELLQRPLTYILANDGNAPTKLQLPPQNPKADGKSQIIQYQQKNGNIFSVTTQIIPANQHKKTDTTILLLSGISSQSETEEQKRENYLHYLKSMSRISKTLGQPVEIEKMLHQTIREVFDIFDCDRAWLLYPCDPNEPSYQVPYEHTRPEFPGANDLNMDIPITDIAKDVFIEALADQNPVTFTYDSQDFLTDDEGAQVLEPLSIKSQMVTAIYPKVGKPWLIGLHQCSFQRIWSSDEQKLFKDIAVRMADALTEKILFQNLRQNEEQTQSLLDLARNLEQSHTYSDVLKFAYKLANTYLGYKTAWIYLYDEDLKTVRLLTIEGALANKVIGEASILTIEGDSFLEEITKADHIVVVEDALSDPRTNKKIVAQLGNRTIVNLPLVLFGKRLGALGMGTFGDEGVLVPTQAQLDFLEAIGRHLSVAIDRVKLIDELDQRAQQLSDLALENAQLFNTATRRAHELAVLMRLGQAISANLDLQTVLETTYQSIGLLMDNDAFWIATYEQNSDYAQFLIRIDKGEHYPTDRFSIKKGIAGHVIRTGKPFIGDQQYMEKDLHHITPMHYGSSSPVDSIICVPLLIGNQVIGAMSTQSYSVNAYTKTELELLVKLAQPIAIALENARLFEAERAARERVETLQAATQVLSTTLDLPQVFELILSELQQVIPYDSTSVQRLKDGQLEIIGGRGFPNLDELLGVKFNLDGNSNPNREVIETRKPFILNDAPTLYRGFHTQPHAEASIRSWLGVPLIFGDRLIGMLALDKKEPNFYSSEHAKLALAFAAQAASAIENAQLYDRLRDYAAQLENRVAERTSELEEANVRLQELDRLKSKFVSDVSHELRTPVTNLNLYLDLLERGKKERHAEYLEVLRKQAGRLKELIEDILDLSRLDLMRSERMEFKLVNLTEVANEVTAVHLLRAETVGLRLVFNPGEEDVFIWGERNQLSQVITNLVVNAINYTFSGHIDVRIFLDSAQKHVYLEVADTGMGILPDDLPHLFDRFYRGQHTGQITIPGNGLGLAIVQEIVQNHDGRIEINSVVGKGTLFQIIFPHPEMP